MATSRVVTLAAEIIGTGKSSQCGPYLGRSQFAGGGRFRCEEAAAAEVAPYLAHVHLRDARAVKDQEHWLPVLAGRASVTQMNVREIWGDCARCLLNGISGCHGIRDVPDERDIRMICEPDNLRRDVAARKVAVSFQCDTHTQGACCATSCKHRAMLSRVSLRVAPVWILSGKMRMSGAPRAAASSACLRAISTCWRRSARVLRIKRAGRVNTTD